MTPTPVLLMVRELNLGGCERDVAKMAVFLDRSRFTPHVGCFVAKGFRFEELKARQIPVVEFPVRSFLSPSVVNGARVMARYLREHGIRLVHPYDLPTSIFGVPVARLCGIPGIASQLSYRNHLYSREALFLIRMVDRISTKIVVNSKEIQRHLIQEQGVSPALTYLCYNGVDTSEFHARDRGRMPGLEQASVVIGVVCVLRPEKGLTTLIEAFGRLRGEPGSIKLVIIGDGPQRGEIEALRDRLGVQDDLLMFSATREVARWMRSIDIFVLPSMSESFSNALLEAMACGCCCIGSRVGGTPELIEDEASGLLFDAGDVDGLTSCLRRLIRDEALRQRLAKAAEERAATEFSMEKAARRTGDLYRTVLDETGPDSRYS